MCVGPLGTVMEIEEKESIKFMTHDQEQQQNHFPWNNLHAGIMFHFMFNRLFICRAAPSTYSTFSKDTLQMANS